MTQTLTVTAVLWLWNSDKAASSWHFLSIGGAAKEAIEAHAAITRLELGLARKRGWGSVKVEARLGGTVWQTSIFPDRGNDRYLLPIKSAVRKAEAIAAGDTISVSLMLI